MCRCWKPWDNMCNYCFPFKVRMLAQKLEYPRRIRKWPSALLVYTPVRYLRTYTYTYTYTSQNDRSARTPNLRVRVDHEITDLPYTYTLLHIMHIIIMADPVVDKVRHGMWYTARYGVDLQFKRTMVTKCKPHGHTKAVRRHTYTYTSRQGTMRGGIKPSCLFHGMVSRVECLYPVSFPPKQIKQSSELN